MITATSIEDFLAIHPNHGLAGELTLDDEGYEKLNQELSLVFQNGKNYSPLANKCFTNLLFE
jgi:hypothetical protein